MADRRIYSLASPTLNIPYADRRGHNKNHISHLFQSTDEQKLIYSGQLLGDSVVLKDVLRQYEGQDAHTVHLVYTPKNQRYYTKSPCPVHKEPMSTNRQSTDGASSTVNATGTSATAQVNSSGSTTNATSNAATSDGLR